MVESALKRLAEAKNVWSKVHGPGAALVATCWRLHWKVCSATKLITDRGELVDLRLDSPAVVQKKVIGAVKRWRWRRIERKPPQLAVNGSGSGAFIEPVWSALNTKKVAKRWSGKQKGSYKSAMTGRQYTQSRVKVCEWSTHDRCLLCLHKIVKKGHRQQHATTTLAATTTAAGHFSAR